MPRYEIDYANSAIEDIQGLKAYNRAMIAAGIDSHLRFEPDKPSRSRIKQMNQPFWCEYRLRIDDFRVYYDVDKARKTVTVLRILEKGRGTTVETNT